MLDETSALPCAENSRMAGFYECLGGANRLSDDILVLRPINYREMAVRRAVILVKTGR